MAKAARNRKAAAEPAPSERRGPWRALPAAVIVAAALLAHGAGLEAPFHFDDFSLPGDPAMGRSDGWVEILTDPARTRPLTYLTFWLNERLHGFTPSGFHAVNLGIFALLLVCLARLYRQLVPPLAAAAALAVFALHPLQTEAVTYTFARATLLAALFSVLAWHSWVRRRPWPAVVWFLAAMLAKEEAAALPVFLAGYELAVRRSTLRAVAAPLAAMAAIVAVAAARLWFAVQQTVGSGAGAEDAGVSTVDYMLTQGRTVWLYLRLLLAPFGQTVDRDWTASSGLDLSTAAAWIALLTAVGAGLYFIRRRPEIYWWLGGLILLAPTSSLIPLADLTAERRLLFPLLSLSLGVGLLVQRLPLKAGVAALVALILGLGALTARRTQVWLSEESLWRDATEKSPGKVRPKLQLARALESRGAVADAERLSLLEQARRLEPQNPVPLAEMGVFHLQHNRPQQALEAFEDARQLSPDDAQVRANIGSSLWLLGRRVEAVEAFRTALALDPCNFDARNNLLLALSGAGFADERRRLAIAPPGCRFSPAQREAFERVRP